MAGPNGTALLDDFNRANSSSLGGNWTADPFGFGLSSLQIASNQCVPASDTYGANSWGAGSFTADMEAYMTVATNPSNNVRLLCRLSNVGTSSVCGYSLIVASAGVDLYRIDNQSLTFLLNVAGVPSAGDKWAISCVGSTISAYRDHGSGWGFLFSQNDATYPTGSRIGLYSQANSALALDDFGGGSIVSGYVKTGSGVIG